MVKFTKAPVTFYAEIAQQSSTKFSFVNEIGDGEYKEIFSPVKCRDFLGDAVCADATGKIQSIYSFCFNPAVQQLDKDACRMYLSFGDEAERGRFVAGISFLHEIEKQNNLETTEVYQADDCGYILVSDKFWQSSVWSISLFSFIIRYCCRNKKDSSPNEVTYMNKIGETNWELLTRNLQVIKKVSEDPTGWDTPDISTIHNGSGIIALFRQGGFEGKNAYREAFDALPRV